MDILKLLSPAYLFATRNLESFAFIQQFTIWFLMLLAAGFATEIALRTRTMDPFVRKLVKRIPGPLYTFGIVGLLLVWFRYEAAPYLSMRFLLLGLMIGFIWWVATIAFEARQIPHKRAAHSHEERMRRYRPR